MRILIIDPSDICSLGSGQIKKLLVMLYALKIADLEVRLIVNCESMVVHEGYFRELIKLRTN
jgi:hypothetical protein